MERKVRERRKERKSSSLDWHETDKKGDVISPQELQRTWKGQKITPSKMPTFFLLSSINLNIATFTGEPFFFIYPNIIIFPILYVQTVHVLLGFNFM